MANTFLSSTQIASAALGLLRRDIMLPATVYRSAQADFTAGSGATVNIRKPASLSARVYTDTLRTAGTPITVDDLTETSASLVLDNHIYSAVAVTDEQLTLDIVNFGRQVLEPQTVAVAEDAEDVLAAKMNALATELTVAAGGTDIHEQIIAARRTLNQANVPQRNRWLAVSPEIEAQLLQDTENRLVKYDASGDSPNVALREAIVGRLYGFNVVVSNALTAYSAVAYHQDAFAFAMVAPAVPDGATFGRSISDNGMALRWLRDYDAAFLRDRSVVSVLAGAVLLDGNRVVKLLGSAAV